jgi:hypothetical protein
VPEAQGLAATICLTSLDSRTTPQSSTCIARQVPGVASVSEESEHVLAGCPQQQHGHESVPCRFWGPASAPAPDLRVLSRTAMRNATISAT